MHTNVEWVQMINELLKSMNESMGSVFANVGHQAPPGHAGSSRLWLWLTLCTLLFFVLAAMITNLELLPRSCTVLFYDFADRVA